MAKKRGDRRTSLVKLRRVLKRIGKRTFTTEELTAACRAERVKYDTVQRAMLRHKMITAWGYAPLDNGTLPKGAPGRMYANLDWVGPV